MDHNLPGVYEYLFTNKTLLKEGDLSPEAARTLERKIDDLSSLHGEDDLGEEEHTPPY